MIRSSLSGSLALLFSCRTFPVSAGGIVLVLHILAGASKLRHTSSGFCLEPQHPLERFLLSERESLHCHVCLHITRVALQPMTSFSLEKRDWNTRKPDIRWDAWDNSTFNYARNEGSSVYGLLQLHVTRGLWLECYSPSVMLLVRKFCRKQNVTATLIWHLVVKWFVYMLELDRQCMCANVARYSITIMLLTQADSFSPLYNKMSNYCHRDNTFPSNFTLVILTEQEGLYVKTAPFKADLEWQDKL